jgi:hypothetical protein
VLVRDGAAQSCHAVPHRDADARVAETRVRGDGLLDLARDVLVASRRSFVAEVMYVSRAAALTACFALRDCSSMRATLASSRRTCSARLVAGAANPTASGRGRPDD